MKRFAPVKEWLAIRGDHPVVPLSYSALLVSCPKCGAEPEFYCETPKGRKAQESHPERYRNIPKEARDRAMIKRDVL